MDKLARMESLWLDPDYDWETGEYDDSWGPEPEEKRSVYKLVRDYMEEAKHYFYVKEDIRKDLEPGEFREWLFQALDEDFICLPYDEWDINNAITEIWEEI